MLRRNIIKKQRSQPWKAPQTGPWKAKALQHLLTFKHYYKQHWANFRNKSNRGRDGQILASGCLVTLELLDLCAMVFSSVKWGWEPLPHGAVAVGASWIRVMGISRVSPVDWPLNYLLLLRLPPQPSFLCLSVFVFSFFCLMLMGLGAIQVIRLISSQVP